MLITKVAPHMTMIEPAVRVGIVGQNNADAQWLAAQLESFRFTAAILDEDDQLDDLSAANAEPFTQICIVDLDQTGNGQMCQRLRGSHPAVPVIAMARSQAALDENCPVDAVLLKGQKDDALLSIVGDAVSNSLVRRLAVELSGK